MIVKRTPARGQSRAGRTHPNSKLIESHPLSVHPFNNITTIMKTLKSLTFGALLLASAGVASAQTEIYIVASNGDRNATQTAISKLLASGWVYQGISGAGNTSSSGDLAIATGSNFGTWNGTFAGQHVIIRTAYSGALAGVQAVAGGSAITPRFPATDGTGTGPVPNPLTSNNPADYVVHQADFGFSTNYQTSSPFLGVFDGVTYSPIIEEEVGISPLGFYGSPGFPGSPTSDRPDYQPNITTALAQQLYTTGWVRLSQFTGDHSRTSEVNPAEGRYGDYDKIVYAIGRNTDAGQRFGAYAEIGLGFTTSVRVWRPIHSAQTTTSGITYGGVVSELVLWPANFQPGSIPVLLGSGGYNSGANLAAALTLDLSEDAYKGKYIDPDTGNTEFLHPDAADGFFVGYITPGDANNRLLGQNGVLPVEHRGVSLSYNGVPLTAANVKNGTYTAWLYNRLLKPQTGLGGLKLQFADALRDQIRTVDAVSGGGIIDDDTVKVRRFADGGFVIPK